MNLDELQPEVIIQGSRWDEPVRVFNFRMKRKYVQIMGALTHSGQSIDEMISVEEIPQMSIVALAFDRAGDPLRVFLAIESLRYDSVSSVDHHAAHASKIDLLPHQIDAVYNYVLRKSKIRFLLADDPGAGKTIMAGLIIKELKLRKIVNRVLIVVPGHLQHQWISELQDKFNEQSILINRGQIGTHYTNPWSRADTIVTSIDFAKQKDVLKLLDMVKFDLIIVDEAHKMSAQKVGRKIKKTARYRLGEIISKISENLLLLTATPHNGKPENFRLLLDLLYKGFFATDTMMKKVLHSKENPLFLRRVKENMVDFNGKPLFVPRHVKMSNAKMSDVELELYAAVTRYVQYQYGMATDDNRNNVIFTLMILQRRAASSTFALHKSLNRRKENLEKILSGDNGDIAPYGNVDDMDAEQRENEEKRWELFTIEKDKDGLEEEIDILKDLIYKSKQVMAQRLESKLCALKETMESLTRQQVTKKILIFTEYKDTLEYLAKNIRGWNYSVNTIHGQMNMAERKNAESVFKNETQIMVATDAASEGINLQFCHLMINYDLPWNPNRLEQRMGRIHRYGQQTEVTIFNLVASETREGQVMNRLFTKLEQIKVDLGSDKVFDVIGTIIDEKNLAELLENAVMKSKDMTAILQTMNDKMDIKRNNELHNMFNDGLDVKLIDHKSLLSQQEKTTARKLNPEYTKSMFMKAFQIAGGKTDDHDDGSSTLSLVPDCIRNVSDEFRNRYGEVHDKYSRIAFDKRVAMEIPNSELVGFGHPVFESVLEWIREHCILDAKRGSIFTDPDGKMDGHILFYTITLSDGTGSDVDKKFVAYFVDDKKVVTMVPGSILWDLEQGGNDAKPSNVPEIEAAVAHSLHDTASSFRRETLDKRLSETEAKSRHKSSSVNTQINDLKIRLFDMYVQEAYERDMRLAIHNIRKQIKILETEERDFQLQIKAECSITTKPSLSGWVRVIPRVVIHNHDLREVENAGMIKAIEYERLSGRHPEDVSAKNEGYDIISRDDKGNARYIEVKALSGRNAVSLTRNEWFTAKNLSQKYYLYVVFDALKSESALHIAQDPANNIPAEFAFRYLIQPTDIENATSHTPHTH